MAGRLGTSRNHVNGSQRGVDHLGGASVPASQQANHPRQGDVDLLEIATKFAAAAVRINRLIDKTRIPTALREVKGVPRLQFRLGSRRQRYAQHLGVVLILVGVLRPGSIAERRVADALDRATMYGSVGYRKELVEHSPVGEIQSR
jgi:hypothetical protein